MNMITPSVQDEAYIQLHNVMLIQSWNDRVDKVLPLSFILIVVSSGFIYLTLHLLSVLFGHSPVEVVHSCFVLELSLILFDRFIQ